MKPRFFQGFIFFLIIFALGCSHVTEAVKVFWGSSTRALEQARGTGVSATYDCNVELCFQDVLDLAKEKELDVFIEDHKKHLIVLIGFDVTINSTEAGVFFEPLGSKSTRVEVVSLGDAVQRAAANLILKRLGTIYNED